MNTEKHVFYLDSRVTGSATRRFTIKRADVGAYQENYVAAVDVVLSVPAIALEGRLVHDEISPVSTPGVAMSRDASRRWRTLVWWGGS